MRTKPSAEEMTGGREWLKTVSRELIRMASPTAPYSKAASAYVRCFRNRGWVSQNIIPHVQSGAADMTAPVTASSLVRRLWHYCNVLRDDGLSYPDYVEQLTYLLFLKMAEEQTPSPIPRGFGWQSLVGKDADAMHRHYSATLAGLGRQGGGARIDL